MKILVLNCGSSSVKYKLFNMDTHEVLAQGRRREAGFAGFFPEIHSAGWQESDS